MDADCRGAGAGGQGAELRPRAKWSSVGRTLSLKQSLREVTPPFVWRLLRRVLGKLLAADFGFLWSGYPKFLLRSDAFRSFVISRNSMWRTALSERIAGRFSGPLERLGSDYGGWKVPTGLMGRKPMVYSLGIGDDMTFDLAIIDRLEAEVFAFDPTPIAKQHVGQAASDVATFHFLPLGIWSSDTEIKFFVPWDDSDVSHSIVNLQGTDEFFMARVLTLHSAMEKLGHASIDYLKIDIEGAQFEVLKSAIRDKVSFKVLAVEIDQPSLLSHAVDLLARLDAAGYELIDIDGWNFLFVRRDLLQDDWERRDVVRAA
jgi:FkbM family methyltransferase